MADQRIFNPEVYQQAAQEHMTATQRLQEAKEYVAAFYLAGLAVECLLHAYHYRRDPAAQLDTSHDLRRLADQSGFHAVVPENKKEEIDAAMADVWSRWRNTHRYRSKDALRKYLTAARLYRHAGNKPVKGDLVAFNCGVIVEAMMKVVALGVALWKTSKAG